MDSYDSFKGTLYLPFKGALLDILRHRPAEEQDNRADLSAPQSHCLDLETLGGDLGHLERELEGSPTGLSGSCWVDIRQV